MATKMHEFGKYRDPTAPETTFNVPGNTKVHHGSWIVTIPLAAIAAAYIMFFFLPGRRATGELHDQIRQNQDCIGQATGRAMVLQTVQRELVAAQRYNAAWEENAPAPGETSVLYGKINALAKAAGTTVTRFDPEPVVPYDKIRKIPVTMGCAGSFAQIYEFLRRLEDLPAEIWEETLKIEKLEGDGEPVTCELTLAVFANNPEDSD